MSTAQLALSLLTDFPRIERLEVRNVCDRLHYFSPLFAALGVVRNTGRHTPRTQGIGSTVQLETCAKVRGTGELNDLAYVARGDRSRGRRSRGAPGSAGSPGPRFVLLIDPPGRRASSRARCVDGWRRVGSEERRGGRGGDRSRR